MKGLHFQTAYRTAFAVFLLAVCFRGNAQEPSEEDFSADPSYLGSVLNDAPDLNTLKIPEIRKVSFSFTTGMMLGTSGHKNNFAAAYIAPAVAYSITPRFRVRAGGVFTSSPSGESSAGIRNNVALFVAADYRVTDRITITGSYYKLPENNLFRQSIAPEVYNRYNTYYRMPSESMSLGLNYEIAKGLYFGAEFRFSNDYQPSINSFPFMPGNSEYDPLTW